MPKLAPKSFEIGLGALPGPLGTPSDLRRGLRTPRGSPRTPLESPQDLSGTAPGPLFGTLRTSPGASRRHP